jgi:deoxyribodipyrimidine photolyase-related protein
VPVHGRYWAFLHRNRDRLADNHRMKQPLAGLRRLDDIDEVVAAESRRRRY